MGDDNNNNTNNEIQASTYVSSQSLFSNSIPSSPNNSTSNFNQLGSRKSSKSEIGETAIVEGHYEGNMERFFQSEVRPVYFGNVTQKYLL
jgi:hypothetical protein